jgi:hypothetical protein
VKRGQKNKIALNVMNSMVHMGTKQNSRQSVVEFHWIKILLAWNWYKYLSAIKWFKYALNYRQTGFAPLFQIQSKSS